MRWVGGAAPRRGGSWRSDEGASLLARRQEAQVPKDPVGSGTPPIQYPPPGYPSSHFYFCILYFAIKYNNGMSLGPPPSPCVFLSPLLPQREQGQQVWAHEDITAPPFWGAVYIRPAGAKSPLAFQDLFRPTGPSYSLSLSLSLSLF